MKVGLATACILALSLALAAPVIADQGGKDEKDQEKAKDSEAPKSKEPTPEPADKTESPPPAETPVAQEPAPAAASTSGSGAVSETESGDVDSNAAANANSEMNSAHAETQRGAEPSSERTAEQDAAKPDRKENDSARADRKDEKDAAKNERNDAKDEAKEQDFSKEESKERKDEAKDAEKAQRESERENRTADRAGGRDDAPGQERREETPAGAFTGGASTGAGGEQAPPPAQIPEVAIERSSVPEENTHAAIVRVQAADNRTLDVAQGDVRIAGEGVENETTAFVVLIHPNGTEEILAEGTSEAPWNTTAYENGYYTVEVRERSSSGAIRTAASTRVLVENPRAEVIAAVAAVATSAAVSAGAGILATRSFDLLGMLKMAGGEAATEAATQKAEDKLRLKTASVATIRWRGRSAFLLLSAAGWLAFFKVFATRDDILLTLPIAFLAAFVYTVGDYGAEWSLARASGAQTQFKLWTPGALSLAVSALLFRSPFGYPGYVSETDIASHGQRSQLRSRAGFRALAFMGAGIALTLPFLLLGRVWRWEIAEYGVSVALMMAAAGAMPFSPMPGRDVWSWSKLAWLGAFGTLAALYVLWQIAALPLAVLVSCGVVGACGFAFALVRLRKAPASTAAP